MPTGVNEFSRTPIPDCTGERTKRFIRNDDGGKDYSSKSCFAILRDNDGRTEAKLEYSKEKSLLPREPRGDVNAPDRFYVRFRVRDETQFS